MLILIGCSHRSAPVAFRERIAFGPEELPLALDRLLEREGIEEALILSTCNRVELLVCSDHSQSALQSVKGFLCEMRETSPEELERHSYHFEGRDAVRHLFEVAVGLDSMILGEPQILGQVKQAYLEAKRRGTTGSMFDRLLQQCLASAKRVRTETGISRRAVSVAHAAVNLARQIFGELAGREALLIGSGKMTQLVAKHLVERGVSKLSVTSRTFNNAVLLAERCGGEAIYWDEGLALLNRTDIVVSCTASPRTILGPEMVAQALRRRRGKPLFIIDLAVPRDVDPRVNEIDNVYVYDIDGLQNVVDTHHRERREAAEQARLLIEREVDAFDRWRQTLEVTPTIVSLREQLTAMARRELERGRRRLGPLNAEQHRAIEELLRGLVQKMLHRPVMHLRKSVERGDIDASTTLYREIFGLDESPGENLREEDDGAGPRRLLRGGKDDQDLG